MATAEQIAEVISREAQQQGFALPHWLCVHIAQQIIRPSHITDVKPGDVARRYRERYDDSCEDTTGRD